MNHIFFSSGGCSDWTLWLVKQVQFVHCVKIDQAHTLGEASNNVFFASLPTDSLAYRPIA